MKREAAFPGNADVQARVVGRLELTFARRSHRTIVERVYSEGVLKVSHPLYLADDAEVCCYLIHLGGGCIGGDIYRTWIDVQENAQVVLTTQSATKVYKTPVLPVEQTMHICLGPASCLDIMADPIIAYEGARFVQVTEIDMAADATLVWTDIFTAGWSPDGRLHAYDEIRTKLLVRVDGVVSVFDHVRLRSPAVSMSCNRAAPGEWALRIGQLEGYTHYGSMIVLNPRIDAEFLEGLWADMERHAGACRFGLSQLRVPGFAVRVLSRSTDAIEALYDMVREAVRHRCLGRDAVFVRKY